MIFREERTKELEVLYKDFVERDNLEKVFNYLSFNLTNANIS